MKILIICSTSFYDRIKDIKEKLEEIGHIVHMPNCYDSPVTNDDNKMMSHSEYIEFFKRMYIESRDKIKTIDAVLVLNYTKEKKWKKIRKLYWCIYIFRNV